MSCPMEGSVKGVKATALIKSIRYGRTFNLGNYESTRLEIEADLSGPDESPAEEMLLLKALIEAMFAEQHPSAPKRP